MLLEEGSAPLLLFATPFRFRLLAFLGGSVGVGIGPFAHFFFSMRE